MAISKVASPAEGQGKASENEQPKQRHPQHQANEMNLHQARDQVNQVIGIMRTNFEKLFERDQKLSELDERAEALEQGASQFERQTAKLKRKVWWKNYKMIIVMIIIGIVFVVVIAVLESRRR
ncbi:Synaptobrevin, partial [Stegodyphus mimosarum]